MKKYLFLIFTLLLFVLSIQATIPNVHFLRTPAISPDGTQIVFSYDKDLWLVDSKGGTAYRITGMKGLEQYPRFSPDGKWIAFSGSQEGNANVYIIPVKGGIIKQLTFHDANDRVDSWSWDSKYIYFNSSRYNNFSEYKVNIKGETPLRIFDHYFNTVHGVVSHPKTNDLYFTDTWESLAFASRKRYKGEYNPDIKSYNIKTKDFKVHTNYRGKDFFPSIDKMGNVYFISDRFNGEYNLYRLNGTKKEQLTSFSNSIKSPQVSADGSTLVFLKDYQIFLYDVKAKKIKTVKIALFNHDTLHLKKDFNIKNSITNFDVSGDGEKFVFISRGELFVSDIKGLFIKQIRTSSEGRILQALWLKDNKTILFNQTHKGWQNIYKIAVDQVNKEIQLTNDEKNNRNLQLNSDKTQAVYLSGSTHLKMLDLKTLKTKTLLTEEFWGFYNSQPYFSPDDKYIVFTAYRNFEQDIFLHRIDSGKTHNLTGTGISESSPYWSPDGKYIYFSSNRYKPNFPRGSNETKIYRMPLHKYLKPFRSDKLKKLFEPKKNKKITKKNDKDKTPLEKKKTLVSFDLSEMSSRWERISQLAGTQFSPVVIIEKEKTFVIYTSNHDGKWSGLWITCLEAFKKPVTKKFKKISRANTHIVKSKNKYYILAGGKISELNLKTYVAKPILMKYSFRKNLRDEFNQMFSELQAGVSENFYDDKFHGVNWGKIGKYYSQFLPFLTSRSDLRILIADMLGELNASHLGFTSSGSEEKGFYTMRTMSIGVLFKKSFPYVVKSIVKDSAADKREIDILPGDRLVAINDVLVDENKNREFYFRGPSILKEIELSFKRLDRIVKLKLHPESSFAMKNNLYNEWIRTNQKTVDKKSDKRIAYIHMKNMGSGELNKFLIEMTNETYHRKGLILDLRYNTGGNVHDAVLNFLSQKPYSYWKYRTGAYSTQPHFAPAAKPIVILINEQTLSDGEMVTAGFKALKLGKVIGTETYRWIIFTSKKRLVDGSSYRLPAWGCYTLDKKNLEIHGVSPDIYIKNTFKDRLEDKDPQLNAAIKEILKKTK